LLCPLADFCQARQLGLTDSIPQKRRKQATVEVQLAALVLVDANYNTLLLSPSHHLPKSGKDSDVAALLSRMWHFPTIAVSHDPERDLRMYVRAKRFRGLRSRAKFLPLSPVHHTVTHRDILVFPFRTELRELPDVPGAKHLPLHDLSSVPISSLTRKVAAAAALNQKQ
jgi:adenine-specific DNA glycosylase